MLKYSFTGCVNDGCHGDSAEKTYKYKIKGFQAVIYCHYLSLYFFSPAFTAFKLVLTPRALLGTI